MAKRPLTAEEKEDKSYDTNDFTSLNEIYQFTLSLDGLNQKEKDKLYESLREKFLKEILNKFSREVNDEIRRVNSCSYFGTVASESCYRAILDLCKKYKQVYPNFDYEFSDLSRSFTIKVANFATHFSIK